MIILEELEKNYEVLKQLKGILFEDFRTKLRESHVHFYWTYDGTQQARYVSWGKCVAIFDENDMCIDVVNKKKKVV